MELSKTKNIIAWVLQILLAAMFVMAAFPKLTSDAETVANFARWGMPDNIHLVIGFFEILGAIGLLIPKLAGFAAAGLILIMAGAVFTHLTHGEYTMSLFPLILMSLLGVVAYFRLPFGKK